MSFSMMSLQVSISPVRTTLASAESHPQCCRRERRGRARMPALKRHRRASDPGERRQGARRAPGLNRSRVYVDDVACSSRFLVFTYCSLVHTHSVAESECRAPILLLLLLLLLLPYPLSSPVLLPSIVDKLTYKEVGRMGRSWCGE